MIRAAEKLVSRGKLEAAIKQYRKVLRAVPDDTGTLNRLGDLYARLDRLDEAVDIFSRAADHFVSEGFLVKAIAIFKKIIRLDPTRISVYETLADLYHRQGLRNEARSQYQVVADYFQQSGDLAKVRAIYERMVELEPNNPSHRVKLAEHYCEAGMIPEATGQYQLIASFMLQHGRIDEALRVYRGAFALSPTDLGFLTDVVLHLVDGGHPEAANRVLTEAIERNPEAVRVREITGLVAQQQKRGDSAPTLGAPTPDVGETRATEGLLAAQGPPAVEVSISEPALPGTPLPAESLGPEPAPDELEAEGAIGKEATAAESADLEHGLPALEVDDSVLMLGDADLQAAGLDAAAPEASSAPAPDDTEDEVVVLDLESEATELPFAVDTSTVLPERPPDEPTLELEIDLDELELGGPDSEELAAESEEPEAGDLPVVEAVADQTDEVIEVVGDLEGASTGETEEPPESAELMEMAAAERAAEAEFLGEIIAIEPAVETEDSEAIKLGVESEEFEPAVEGVEEVVQVEEVLADAADEVASEDVEAEISEAIADDAEVEPEAAPAAAALETEKQEEGAEEAAVEIPAEALAEAPADSPEEAVAEVAEVIVDGEAEEVVGTAEAAMADEDLVGSESVDVEEKLVLEALLPSDALVGPSAGELLSEARVLVNYGLDSKAVELCERALEIDPDVAGGWGLLVDILHDSGQSELAAEYAERARAALGEGEGQWIEIKGRLIDFGYLVSKARVASPEQALPATEPLIEVERPTFEAPIIEQTSPGWLAVDASTEQSFAQEDEIFGSEEEFFDLAAELEQELRRDEEELSGEFVPQLEEQSLEEIVEGFKRGVAETLSQEDFETHYNLGIAYREMGLLDEAIGEFQLAAKAPDYLVDCCSLLGACFLEKGFPDLAIKWFERGLESPQVTENESLGLLYELGNLYLITGDKDVARKTFADIYGVNSNYRDVVAKLEELKVT
jgi:tetratricopeptide (TPR) repeat protein